MKQEIRTVCFDTELNVEAYNFKGIMQRFPNHFHEYYVIGFIESGKRHLCCRGKEYTTETGDLLLFNPRDNHSCEPLDGETLDYRCINVQPDIMKKVSYEITGKEYLPHFTQQVIFHCDLVSVLSELHLMIMQEERDFKKEELFYFLVEQLIEEYTEPLPSAAGTEQSMEVKIVCEFLENNYSKNITLDDLSSLTNLSKYYLLRSFTKQKGISPYSYLEAVRIGKSKKLLEDGVAPIDVALQTGFSDQSHFTNFFKKFIGLTPKQYMKIFTDDKR